MSKVKGRYVATVILDFEYDEADNIDLRTFQCSIADGSFTNAIRDAICENILDESMGAIHVEQQYADLYRVDEDLYKV